MHEFCSAFVLIRDEITKADAADSEHFADNGRPGPHWTAILLRDLSRSSKVTRLFYCGMEPEEPWHGPSNLGSG